MTATTATATAARERFRAGLRTTTSGWCTGRTQANLISVPRGWAYDLLLLTQRNPRPRPVLDVTDPGSTSTVLAPGADLRTDLPGYLGARRRGGGRGRRGRPGALAAGRCPAVT